MTRFCKTPTTKDARAGVQTEQLIRHLCYSNKLLLQLLRLPPRTLNDSTAGPFPPSEEQSIDVMEADPSTSLAALYPLRVK